MYKSRYNKASSRIAKRNKTRKNFGLFFKIGFPIVFIVCLILLLRADFLQVKSFEVFNAQALSQDDLKNTAASFISGNKFFVLPKSNIFFVDKEKLSTLFLDKFPRLETININKQFFSNYIEFTVTERGADYLWCSASGECFFMSNNGLIFEKAPFSESEYLVSSVSWLEPKNHFIFKGVLTDNPIMRNFVSLDKMQSYEKFVELFKKAGVEIMSIDIESFDKAVAKTSVGDIFFDPEEVDFSEPVKNAVLLINEERAKNPNVKFNYIDTRFGNKMFYKLI